jgi:hypothetical protein
MSLSSSNYAADAYVTAANPAPGRPEVVSYPIRSGTGWTEGFVTKSDGGIGLNVYLAGGVGPSGAIPVSQTNPTQISLSGVTIGGVIEVTSSQANPAWVTGSVYVLNPSSGSGGISGTITATITGVVEVSQSNIQLTQSVYVLQQPIGVTGTVGVSGTASVRVESFSGPVEVTGVVTVSQSNLPLTQSVFVVNQTSGSVTVSGTASVSVTNFPPVLTVSGTGAFDVTVLNIPATQSVYVVNPSSASIVISGALDVTSSQANPVWVTGNFGISGSGGSSVIFVASEAQPSASVVSTVPQTSSVVLLMSASDRLSYSIFNSSSANLHLYFGPLTGTASYFLVPGAVYETVDAVFVGDIYGRWSADGAGFAVVSEYFGNASGSASFTINIGNFPPVQQVTGTVTVAGITMSGSTPIEAYPNALENVQFTRKKQLYDFDSDTVNYVGYAVLGTSVGASAWAIKRLTFNASGNLEAAEWSSTSSIWSNRASEAYS